MQPIIQIAGICDQEEADMLLRAGVHWLGFPLRLTVNAEDLSEAEAERIIRKLPSEAKGVLITYLCRADEIVVFCDQLGAHVVQLHGDISIEELQKLKQMAPHLQIIKSLVIRQENETVLRDLVQNTCKWVDFYITDTFNPLTGQEGATGLTHDWSISRRLVESSPRPVILAGGLNAKNVADAIRSVHPAGVDAHTGVEAANGRKDPEKIRAFVAAAHAAFLK